jgi:urea transport system substrate-binding protein
MIESQGARSSGEAYLPLGSSQLIPHSEDRRGEAGVIFNTINVDSNVAFFRELRAAGITIGEDPDHPF